MTDIEELNNYFKEIIYFQHINALLEWDQQVNLPEGAFKGRSEQMALIQKTYHKMIIAKKTKELINNAEQRTNLNEFNLALLREAKREYDQAIKLPTELVTEIAKVSTIGHQKWADARKKSNFSVFKPCLKKMIELQKEVADKLNTHKDPYSTLIDLYEPEATYDGIAKIFRELKPKLINIIDKVVQADDQPNQDILKKHYASEKQWELSIELLKTLNFDFNIGRQDKSVHPFTTTLSSTDSRITTRIWEDYLPACLFGTIHECGHALYQMGFKENLHDTILADGTSLGIHESQSLLWENIVGKSKEFLTYFYPILQKYFPENLKNYPMEDFYKSINVVEPSFIRVEADEVTYGLHIILRFEIEKEIIDGNVEVSEIPQLWNEKMEKYLGIIPPNDAAGVLQDVHWSGGAFGYFPTYTLGNLYASQIYVQALKKHPNMSEQFKKGDFSTLLSYLRENVHQYGKIYRPLELIKKISGEDLNPKYFIDYLEEKFFLIYNI